MTLIDDLARIERVVLTADPSFRAVDGAALRDCLDLARQGAGGPGTEAFLLSAMLLLALAGNGHTRLIPQDAIAVLPFRFVTIGGAVRLVKAPAAFADAIGGTLVGINGRPVGAIADAAARFLAGTAARRQVIGPILFVWPAALARLGVDDGQGAITYQMRDAEGKISSLAPDPEQQVAATSTYPRSEHGCADPHWTPPSFLELGEFGPRGLLLTLPSFFDPGENALPQAISQAAAEVRARPDAPLVIDVRGNTGGDFLRTMPLIDAIAQGRPERRVAVLVDKFTFSAAIVFVAILKHRLSARLRVIGEEMGDGLTFFAEGGTIDLPSSGAAVRYATAFHDWAEGRSDATTPPEIAAQIVAAGHVAPDQRWCAAVEDRAARDQLCAGLLRSWA